MIRLLPDILYMYNGRYKSYIFLSLKSMLTLVEARIMLIRDKPARDKLGIRLPHLILHVRYEYTDLHDHGPKRISYGAALETRCSIMCALSSPISHRRVNPYSRFSRAYPRSTLARQVFERICAHTYAIVRAASHRAVDVAT